MKEQESLAQYQWRFRLNAVTGAIRHGIGMHRISRALAELGVDLDSPDFPLGAEVPIGSNESVPEGTVVYQGNPKDPHRLAVWVRQRDGWQHLFGGANRLNESVKIAALPGRPAEPPAWLTTPGDRESVDQIKVFKARAFRVGQRVRNEASWCGTYDQVMSAVGVNANSVREAEGLTSASGFRVGDTLHADEVRRTPVGTVFSWVDPTTVGRFAVYRRTERAEAMNPSGTERVCGNRQDGTQLGNYRVGAVVRWLPDAPGASGDWDWRIGRVAEWLPHLPVGTFFRVGDEQPLYHVAQDTRLASNGNQSRSIQEHGQWQAADFPQNYDLNVIGFQS